MDKGMSLKIDRVRRRLPQHRVAAALGIHPSALCAIENGRRSVTPEQADQIRQAMRRLAGAGRGAEHVRAA
jgi:plasmid maintenance system antidote protein VapI